jgi:hypothetical protein
VEKKQIKLNELFVFIEISQGIKTFVQCLKIIFLKRVLQNFGQPNAFNKTILFSMF